MVDTDDTRRTTDDGRRTTPRVWHKLPTGELKKNKFSTKVDETLHFGSIYIKKFKFWVQSVHFWLCDITKHGLYK